MARVCVVGSVNTDLTFTVDTLPHPGETVLATSMSSGPGGKGANQAIAAARAGADVQFIGTLGDDPPGTALLAHLRANRVGTDGVTITPGPTGTAVVMVDATAENAIVAAQGVNAQLAMTSHARTLVAQANVLILQLEIPISTALAAARQARQSRATVLLNASPTPADTGLLADLAATTDVVVVNRTEAAQWHWHVPHLVVTHGARGVSYRGPDGSFDVPAMAVTPVDTTGAGDVFAGVLGAGWPQGPGLALRRASTAAALSTLIAGAGDCAPTDDAIDQALGAQPG